MPVGLPRTSTVESGRRQTIECLPRIQEHSHSARHTPANMRNLWVSRPCTSFIRRQHLKRRMRKNSKESLFFSSVEPTWNPHEQMLLSDGQKHFGVRHEDAPQKVWAQRGQQYMETVWSAIQLGARFECQRPPTSCFPTKETLNTAPITRTPGAELIDRFILWPMEWPPQMRDSPPRGRALPSPKWRMAVSSAVARNHKESVTEIISRAKGLPLPIHHSVSHGG